MELRKLINLFTEQQAAPAVNQPAFDTGGFENLSPNTTQSKPAGPRQGVVGAELAKTSGGQFTSRSDRLNQAKVDAALGPGFKAGSKEANLALQAKFRQPQPPAAAPAPPVQNKPDADAAAKKDVFAPPKADATAPKADAPAAPAAVAADIASGQNIGGKFAKTASDKAAQDSFAQLSGMAPKVAPAPAPAPAEKMRTAQDFAGSGTVDQPDQTKGVFSNFMPGQAGADTKTDSDTPANAPAAAAKTYGAGYDPTKVKYAVDQPTTTGPSVSAGGGQLQSAGGGVTSRDFSQPQFNTFGQRINEYGQDLEEEVEESIEEELEEAFNEMLRLSGLKLNEKAPPGAKAERMVKHIKKGYAKDGKLSDKEKSIAFATAWKAKKAGKLDEGFRVMMDEEGHTLEHIVNRFKHEAKTFLNTGEMSDKLYDALYDYYLDRGEMPYGIAKAREGDPYTWVAARFEADIDGTVDVKMPLGEVGGDDTLNELARLAGLSESRAEQGMAEGQVNECGDMGMDTEDRLNVSTNMSSDGTKSVNISAQGEKAEELLAMLKLAGMGGSDRPSMVVVGNDEEMMDEERETQYANTPEEEYETVDRIIRQGNDLNREKKQFAGKPRLGDNPMAEGQMEFDRDLVELLDSVLIKKDMEENSQSQNPYPVGQDALSPQEKLNPTNNPNKSIVRGIKDFIMNPTKPGM